MKNFGLLHFIFKTTMVLHDYLKCSRNNRMNFVCAKLILKDRQSDGHWIRYKNHKHYIAIRVQHNNATFWHATDSMKTLADFHQLKLFLYHQKKAITI